MKKSFLVSPRKRFLTIFLAVFFILLLPQTTTFLLESETNFGFLPRLSFRAHAQVGEGFFDRLLGPIRRFFFLRQQGPSIPDGATGESGLPDLTVYSFHYFGKSQWSPENIRFRIENNKNDFSGSDPIDDVVIRLYGHVGDEYPYTRTPLTEFTVSRKVLEESLTVSPFAYNGNFHDIPDLSQCVALEVCIDDENSVSESNEENNCLFQTFGDCWECYKNKCKDGGVDFCLGAASETWQREDLDEFSVGSYGDAIYADWTYNPVVYRTSERKEVYQIPFQLCINNEGFAGENSWVNGPHSLTGRGGDVLGGTDNDVGAKPDFVGSAFRACSTSYFIIKMRDLNEWTSDINYASATLFSAHGLWRNIVFVIEGPSLVVRKFVDGKPGEGWDFRAEITDPTDGSVFLDRDGGLTSTKTTDEDGEVGFSVVYTPDRDTATASVTEIPDPDQQSDYKLVDAFCWDEDGHEVGVPDVDRYAVENIPTEVGKKVYCDFFNASPRQITVEKYLDGYGPEPGWEVTPDIIHGEVLPNSTQPTTATFEVYPGADKTAELTLTEKVEPGYEFGSVECHYPNDPGDPGGTLKPVAGAGEITVDIAYNDTDPNHGVINCRFDNLRRTEIKVEKYIDAQEDPKAGWEITATATTNGRVEPPDPQLTTQPPGLPITFTVYPDYDETANVTLTETVKPGYEFKSVTCKYEDGTGVSGDNAQITIPVDYTNPNHGIINCRFDNLRRTEIKVEKYVNGLADPKAEWHITPTVTKGEVYPPHPQLTTLNLTEPLVYKVYPEVGKIAQVVLTETLKRDYYEFDGVSCSCQNGDGVGIAGDGEIAINIPYDDATPGHEIVNCKFYNKTIPSKIGNPKLFFDYKDCVEVPYTPAPEVMKIMSNTDENTEICRHQLATLDKGWLNYDTSVSGCPGSSWNRPNEIWAQGVEGVYDAWVNTGFVPDGFSKPPDGQWYFMETTGNESPKVIQATVNPQQIPWTRDFVRKKFTLPPGRKVTSAKLYFASDNLVKFWLKKSDGPIIPLVGEGDRLDNYRDQQGYSYETVVYDNQKQSGIYEKSIDLVPGDPDIVMPPGEYVLGANLLNWQPFYEPYEENPHPMGIQFLLYIETAPTSEVCNNRDDNMTCFDDDSNENGIPCDCRQNPDHVVDCDEGVDVNEGWKYTWDNRVEPVRMTAVLPGGVTGKTGKPWGVEIPTNSETYSIEVTWGDIWLEKLGGDLIPRNCNPQDPDNSNNSPFCHVYNIGFDVDLELHARRLLVQVMNPQGPGWIDIGGCRQPDPIVSPNTYSCDLGDALLTGDIPDLHQDYVKLRFTLEAPGCGGSDEDGICPDELICGEECTILIDDSNDRDCCCYYDLYQDGVIDGRDCGRITTIGDDRYGTRPGDPGYDPFYDVNGDAVIDHRDVQLCTSSCYGKRCAEQFNPIASLSFPKGDANNDNKVNDLDYALWLASYMKSREADFTGDGVTNELDYVAWWKNYGGQTL